MKRASATLIAAAALAAPHAATATSLAEPAPPVMGAPVPTARPADGVSGPVGKLTLNAQSDRRALVAYAVYLSTVVGQAAAGQASDAAFTATISSQCKAALTPLTQPPYDVNATVQHTLTVLGQEIGDDVSVNYVLTAAGPAFARFAGVLGHLRWARASGAPATVRRYLSSETALLAAAPSNLCLDASQAELTPDSVPDATRAFVRSYSTLSRQANLALTNLTALMQSYETPGERLLVAHISALADQLSTVTRSDLLQSSAALTAVLEAN